MSTVLHPETPSGEYRIQRARPTPAPGSPAALRHRLDHVDLLRGLVMVVMVLDHVRAVTKHSLLACKILSGMSLRAEYRLQARLSR